MEHVLSDGRPEFSSQVQVFAPYMQLAAKCWEASPSHRPSFKQVCKAGKNSRVYCYLTDSVFSSDSKV